MLMTQFLHALIFLFNIDPENLSYAIYALYMIYE